MILYCGESVKKLREAITLGFIEEYLCEDGLPLYVLTNKGMRQWMWERMNARL